MKPQKNHSCKIIFPEDVLIGKSMDGKSKIKELDEVKNDDLILDIGPKKQLKKLKILLKQAKQFCGMVLLAILKIQILLTEVTKLQRQS